MADEPVPNAPIGFGETLKTRRRQKNYTLEMVGQETRISTRFLRALEEEKWSEFPAKVYLEGFLRQYGNFLGLDGEEFVKKWREAQAKVEKPALTRVASTHANETEQESAKSGFRPELIFLGALIVFLGALYFVTARLERSKAKPETEPAPAAVAPVAAPAVQTAAELKIYTKRTVWLRVWTDHRERFEGILPRESHKSWTAQSNFRIQSANTAVLEVTVNDAPLSPSKEKPDEFIWTSTQPVTSEPAASTSTVITPTRSISSASTNFIRRRAPAMAEANSEVNGSTEPVRRRRAAAETQAPFPPIP